MQPHVTFILPVYNTEDYLASCLNSIINQTVQELEIICVDDCSTDRSSSILKEYAQKDPRVRIIHFERNKGPGAARNAGLDAARGQFVRMVDPDDFIPRTSTEKLLQAVQQYDSDFVRGGVWYCDSFGVRTKKNVLSPKERVGQAAIDYRMINYIPHHWAFLYRLSLLHSSGVRYDETMRNGQDAAFIIDLIPYMEKVTLIPEAVYNYRLNDSSTMRKKRNHQFYSNIFNLYRRANEKLSEKGLKEIAHSYLYSHCCGYLPNNILNSIPENLSIDQGEIVLKELQEVFSELEARQLCFTVKYPWQKKRKVPPEMKYILLLLENNLFSEAYTALLAHRTQKKKEATTIDKVILYKKKIDAIHSSTSWRITKHLRIIRNKLINGSS